MYVFKRVGHQWQQVIGLQSSDGIASEGFGTSVSIYGTTIAASSPYTTTGAVYVFREENNTWVQKAKVLPWTPVNNMLFGKSIDLWGSTLLVGAPDYGGGAAFTFNNTDFAGTIWADGQKLEPDQSNFAMNFGASVSLHNNNAIVGAPFYKTPIGVSKGQAYIFKRFNNTWSKYTVLTDEGENGNCGSSVAVDGNHYYIGCPYANGQRGKVTLLHNTHYQGELPTYYNTDADASAEFGTAVAAFDEYFVVGAPVRFPSVTFGRLP